LARDLRKEQQRESRLAGILLGDGHAYQTAPVPKTNRPVTSGSVFTRLARLQYESGRAPFEAAPRRLKESHIW